MMRTALFSLTVVAALTAGAMPGNAADYNMPPDVAQAARARCAKSYASLTSQEVCVQNEGRAYDRLYGLEQAEIVRYSVSEEERKARIRNDSGYRDPPGTRQLR
jgi:hypothetical protein